MTTISPTQARSNLTFWLRKAAAGEDIGILFRDKVIAIRPISVEAWDKVISKKQETSSHRTKQKQKTSAS
jgi:antitoxin (DNA-binding transcriptional repressor) of toxin-antitoxin stability system